MKVVSEPDNPYNNGDDIAQRIDVVINDNTALDIGYVPLKGHVEVFCEDAYSREHYNGHEVNYAFRTTELIGTIKKITGNEHVTYGAVVDLWRK